MKLKRILMLQLEEDNKKQKKEDIPPIGYIIVLCNMDRPSSKYRKFAINLNNINFISESVIYPGLTYIHTKDEIILNCKEKFDNLIIKIKEAQNNLLKYHNTIIDL